MDLGHHGEGFGIIAAPGFVAAAEVPENCDRNLEAAGLRKFSHRLPRPDGIAARRFKQRAFEIARDLDIHRRAQRRLRRTGRVNAFIERACENVVGIGGDDQLFDRKPHAHRGFAGKHIAEIARGHNEDGRRAQLRRRREIIDALRRDAYEVDRVNGRQVNAAREIRVGE